MAKRRKRLKIITRYGSKQVQKLIKQGARPATMYGVAEELLTQVRRTAACGTPPFANGRSLDITLQVANLDPGPDATGAPLIRWAKEIWQATFHAAMAQTHGRHLVTPRDRPRFRFTFQSKLQLRFILRPRSGRSTTWTCPSSALAPPIHFKLRLQLWLKL